MNTALGRHIFFAFSEEQERNSKKKHIKRT